MNGLDSIKTPCLLPCRDAFALSMNRVLLISETPSASMYALMTVMHHLAQSHLKKTGAIPSAFDDFISGAEMDSEEYRAQRRQDRQSGCGDSMKLLYTDTMIDGLASESPLHGSYLDALLTSVVLESWLYFEALASDLWCCSVDNATPAMCHRLNLFQNWLPPEPWIKKKGHNEFHFDPKKNFGSSKVETGQAKFTKTHNISTFYKAAFGESVESVLEDPCDGYFYGLVAVRNSIIHKAGRVDHDFKRSRAAGLEEFKNAQIGQRIELDGKVVAKLRNAAVETGVKLLQYVDGALSGQN